jgi:hypothetical protein
MKIVSDIFSKDGEAWFVLDADAMVGELPSGMLVACINDKWYPVVELPARVMDGHRGTRGVSVYAEALSPTKERQISNKGPIGSRLV